MSKLNQYSVQFVRRKLPNDEVVPNAIIENVNGNSVLNFINGLDEHDTVSFINDLNDCININGNRDEGFFSDSVEHLTSASLSGQGGVLYDLCF
jgi:hypothetical protein